MTTQKELMTNTLKLTQVFLPHQSPSVFTRLHYAAESVIKQLPPLMGGPSEMSLHVTASTARWGPAGIWKITASVTGAAGLLHTGLLMEPKT